MNGIKDILKKPLGQHLAAAVIYGILVFLLTFNLISHLHSNGRGDWDQFYFYNEVPQITIFQYHQFPFWNPYSCGGMPMLANPQSRFFSPSIIFSGVFGVIVGMKLELIVGLLAGMMGMYLLGRFLRMQWPAVLLPGVIFGLNGALALHLTEGHFHFLPAVFFPFIFLFFLKSLDQARWVIFAALFAGVSFLEGGTYVTLFFIIFILVFSILKAVQTKSFRPVVLFLAFLAAAVCWAAPKAFPVIEFLAHHHRPTTSGGYIPLSNLGNIFWNPHQGMFGVSIKEFTKYIGCWELGAYLGLGVVMVYLLSFIYALDQYPLLFAGIFCLILGLGNFAPFSLWNLLHQIPPFSNMVVPPRVFICFIFSVSIMCGFVLDRVLKEVSWRNFISWGVIFFIAGNLLWVGRSIFSEAIKGPIFNGNDQLSIFHDHLDGFKAFRQTYVDGQLGSPYGVWSNLHGSLMNNEGVVNAYESVPVHTKAQPVTSEGYKGEFYLTQQGEAKSIHWSPNEISFYVHTTTGNTLVINQNFDKNWKTQEGFNVKAYQGLLSVDLKAGTYKVTFKYRPLSFMIGCLLFMIVLFTAVFILAKAMVCDIL